MPCGWWRHLPSSSSRPPSPYSSPKSTSTSRTPDKTYKSIPLPSCSFWDLLHRWWSSSWPCCTTGGHLNQITFYFLNRALILLMFVFPSNLTFLFCVYAESTPWSITWPFWTQSPRSKNLKKMHTCQAKRYLQLLLFVLLLLLLIQQLIVLLLLLPRVLN